MKKILVAYFSASGVTAEAAKKIAAATGGELYEIAPAQPYTPADLDWRNSRSRSTLEMNDPASRPAIAGEIKDVSGYDTIFIGFPIWWYVEPRIIDTFLDSGDFTGKTIIPFATSGGSGIAAAERSLKEHCPAAAWKKGRLVNGGSAGWAAAAAKE